MQNQNAQELTPPRIRQYETAHVEKRAGAKRIKWSPAEIEALEKGMDLFGNRYNRWKRIKEEYPDALANRSTVDLKDKIRNLSKLKPAYANY